MSYKAARLYFLHLIILMAFMPACKNRSAKSEVASIGDHAEPELKVYIDACRAAAVPIPPKFGDSRWVNKGTIAKQYIFGANSEFQTTLYIYNSTSEPGNGNGFCAGLARGNPAFSFGVICTSMTTGSTCFWDNKQPGNQLQNASLNDYDISKGVGANHLAENCVACHRGVTPWIRVAGQPHNKETLRSPKIWQPLSLGREEWKLDPLVKVEGCSTGGCHDLPKPNRRYCKMALSMADVTWGPMPPLAIQGANRTSMIQALKRHCSQYQ